MSRWPLLSQKSATFYRLNYTPNPYQWPIHRSPADVVQLVGAEGAGKSHVAASELVANVPWCNLIYIVGQNYTNTHAEFNYMVQFLLQLGAVKIDAISTPKQGAWTMQTLTGCTIKTLSVPTINTLPWVRVTRRAAACKTP